MTTLEILEELADILGTTADAITPQTALNAPGITWDSMALLAYLAFLRFHFNITLPNTTCAQFTTVADLLAPIPSTP